ncbi:Hypothetical protein KVN_LOCUS481 [uncultured virus]|nr:Hypothetical protein KVN_LOCUS481 [uncultured virus]
MSNKKILKKNIEKLETSEESIEIKSEQNIQPDVNNIDKSNVIEDKFLKYSSEIIAKINSNYKEEKENIKKLVKMYKNEMKTYAKKNKKRKTNTKKTGFTKPELVPDNLAKLVGEKQGITMSRTELTKKIYDVFRDRGLFYEKDKRVLRADTEILKIFNLPNSVNESNNAKDKNGLNFYTIQKYIANCYKNLEHKKIQRESK